MWVPILLSTEGKFLSLFVCCCYRITHTAFRWDELCFAQLPSETGSKWPWSKITLAKFQQFISWLSESTADTWGALWGREKLLKNCSFAWIRENPPETGKEPGFAHMQKGLEVSKLTKQTTSSSSSSAGYGARNSRNTTVGSSAFSLGKMSLFNLLGTKQQLWCNES